MFFDKHIFFMGQLSVFATAAVRRSLSSSSIPHSSCVCSAVWLPFPHGHNRSIAVSHYIVPVRVRVVGVYPCPGGTTPLYAVYIMPSEDLKH